MHDYYQPAWCFNSVLPGAKSVAECVSHELGHNVGLNHDGQVPGSGPYYTGHDPWAPVMGVGYYQPVTQFSKGEYANATNTEDDLVVMATYGLMQRADDHTNVTTTATVLVATQAGVITSEADYDTFRFDVPSTGSVTFVASPTPVSPNLDIEPEIVLVVVLAAHDQRSRRHQTQCRPRQRDGRLDHALGRCGRDVLRPGVGWWPPHGVDRLHAVREHRGVRTPGEERDRDEHVQRHVGNDRRLGRHPGHTRRRCDRRQRRR